MLWQEVIGLLDFRCYLHSSLHDTNQHATMAPLSEPFPTLHKVPRLLFVVSTLAAFSKPVQKRYSFCNLERIDQPFLQARGHNQAFSRHCIDQKLIQSSEVSTPTPLPYLQVTSHESTLVYYGKMFTLEFVRSSRLRNNQTGQRHYRQPK